MKVSQIIGDDARVFTRGKEGRKPRVTIVTPTYRRNAEGMLLSCLRSASEQSFADFEHIIIDDGSSDGTEDIVRRLAEADERIVYVRHDRNCGLPAVRTNEGIIRARGNAIAFLFDDNVFETDFLEQAWPILANDQIDVVHGKVLMPLADGESLVLGAWPVTLDTIRSRNTIANGGVLIRRDFFDRFGLYDPHIVARRLCDWELWIRSLWLGARFHLLPQLVAEEHGTVSPNSLGNTVAMDWTVNHARILDTRHYADRARRLAPAAIQDVDVLDPAQIRPYVRNAREWADFVALIYKPFLDRYDIDFDPSLLTNRVESADPVAGWNPSWALHQRRFRVLLLSNCVNALASFILESVRSIPGAIVLNMPDWALAILAPGAFDLIIILDGGAPFVPQYLQAHDAAGARLLYISAYGERHVSERLPVDIVPITSNPHLVNCLDEPLPYFPLPGYDRPAEADEPARRQKELSDLVVNMSRQQKDDEINLPSQALPALATTGSGRTRRIAFRVDTAQEDASETFARSTGDAKRTHLSESIASLVLSRPGAEIAVERRDLDALPVGELIGLGCLAAARDVDVVAVGGEALPTASTYERAAAAADWQGWFANLVRVLRLRRRLKLGHRAPLTIDVYLNSELFAGSEVYGLRMAKLLSELGIRARVRLPERNIYTEPTAINAWLVEHGLPPAIRAPYLPSVHHSILRPAAERPAAVAKLSDFIRADPPDLILASGHIPQLAEVPQGPPLFMVFFSTAAYEQTWLRDLHGQLHGITSDSEWALLPTAAVIGAPARVIPGPVLGVGGGEIARVTADPQRWPVRVAIAGTIIARKGQLEAVKAVAALRRRGYDIELHLYGFALEITKEYVALVDATIAKEGMTGHIIRHGFVEDGSEITRQNDIVLCASTDESLPQGLFFQMYQGLVGVTVLCGGVDEIVLDGKTGYLTRDPNPASIAEALARALDDRGNWRSITEAARRHIHERCGSAKVTADLLELFDEGLALRQPGYRELEKAQAAQAAQAAFGADKIFTSDVQAPRSDAALEAAKLLTLVGPDARVGRPRIAYFCHSPYLGGAENIILKLARIAAAHSFEPILVLPDAWRSVDAEMKRYAQESGIPIHYLPIVAEEKVETGRHLDILAVAAIRAWLRDHGISLVHSVTFMREVGEAAREEGVPHVASLFATQSLNRGSIEHCDAIHSDTRYYADRWEEVLGTPARRILSSVPDAYFHVAGERPIAHRVEAIRQRPVVGVFGTLQPRKGQLKAIEAIGRLRSEQGVQVELQLFGYTQLVPDYLAECQAAAVAHGVDDLIHFNGFTEEGTHEALRKVDIVLCASDWESLPQSILEGMAAGALIISPQIGGIAEILTEGCGIIIPDNSPHWIASGIMRAVQAPPAELRERMEAARALAAAGCASDVVASAMFQLYAQAVAHRAAKEAAAQHRRQIEAAEAAALLADNATMREAAEDARLAEDATTREAAEAARLADEATAGEAAEAARLAEAAARKPVRRLKQFLGRSRHVRQVHGALKRRMTAGRGDGR